MDFNLFLFSLTVELVLKFYFRRWIGIKVAKKERRGRKVVKRVVKRYVQLISFLSRGICPKINLQQFCQYFCLLNLTEEEKKWKEKWQKGQEEKERERSNC
jgi:hypothetical protein